MSPSIDRMLEELRELGIRVTRRAGIRGQVADTLQMHDTGTWTPEFHRRVREILERGGLSERREGLWGGADADEGAIGRWEEVKRGDDRLDDERKDREDQEEN